MKKKENEIKEIYSSPGLYFKEAIRESRLRSKLCEFYCNYLEDISIIEENYGKNIVKVLLSSFSSVFLSFSSFFLFLFNILRLEQIIVW